MNQASSTNENNHELIKQAEDIVRPHMAKYDPSHDWAHVERVRKTAKIIAETITPTPDHLVIELSALFHDMADAKYTSTTTLPTLLQPFFQSPLAKTSLTPAQISLILKIIPSVSYSTESKLKSSKQWTEWHDTCQELHVVQDADRLDAIGAVGILRVAAFSGSRGRLLLAPQDGGDEGGGNDSAEAHFYDKLLKVRERMKTEYGRQEAENRQATMLAFLNELNRERDLHES